MSLNGIKGLALMALGLVSALKSGCATPLDDYVWKPDANYAWYDMNTPIEGKGAHGVTWTGHVINMTSQQWLTYDDVDRSIWYVHEAVQPHPYTFHCPRPRINLHLYLP